jgi:hypothetical protein
MLTMVVPEAAGIGGTGDLRIVKVGDCEIAHGERKQSVC